MTRTSSHNIFSSVNMHCFIVRDLCSVIIGVQDQWLPTEPINNENHSVRDPRNPYLQMAVKLQDLKPQCAEGFIADGDQAEYHIIWSHVVHDKNHGAKYLHHMFVYGKYRSISVYFSLLSK